MYCQHLLSVWLAVVGSMSLGNTIQCFIDHRFFEEKLFTTGDGEVTAHSARMFGIWTLMSCVVRLQAARDLCSPRMYETALASFFIDVFYCVSEVYHGTATWSAAMLIPLSIACVTSTWMIIARPFIAQDRLIKRE